MGMVALGADSDKKNTLSFAHLYSLLGYLERALFCKFLCVMDVFIHFKTNKYNPIHDALMVKTVEQDSTKNLKWDNLLLSLKSCHYYLI